MAAPGKRNKLIALIPLEYNNGSCIDTVTEGTRRNVWAGQKSIRQSEFYQAFANGLRPEITFILRSIDYNNEPRLAWGDVDYEIVRTFTSKDERELELICQPLDLIKTGLSRLRDTIEIWHNTIVENSMGEKSPSTALLYTLPAHIEYKGGGSGTTGASDTIVTETTNNATVIIKYREGITSAMFLKINEERWDIRFIEDPYNRHETLILHVERKLP